MKYLIVFTLILVYISFGNELGYTNASPLYTHFTYMFQHASALHLLINSLAFIGTYTSLEKHMNRWVFLGLSSGCSVLASFGAMHDEPTVGISGAVYVMTGLYTGITLLDKHIKIADTRKYLLYIGCIIISLSVSFVKGNSNFLLHLDSLVIGMVISVPVARLKSHADTE
ncbi:rhomboid family intramembrane serine protease [Dysgonomonas sp. GY75]|uniref:rhomboid family intramembrane serine protease n=1 Tax=Dysgonomonas sp. GY75 TaxID=2780419 RepID=UPI00188358D8|nr:rhomboid family intramembrane serine protease [Dysgonomonas sp. GY75]MBF0651074.1 rhomboid family intramembrane serine protease [Dysgonomonas sp. GY75]